MILPRLHVVLDLAFCRSRGVDPVAVATRIAEGGRAVALHLRAPGEPASEVRRLAGTLRAVIAPPALLIVNGHPDIAVAVGADGAQVGGQGVSLGCVRGVIGRDMLLGRSAHSAADAAAAEREGADYALLGTVYPTASHPDGAHGGLALVRAARAAARLPIVAIGGIDRTNIGAVLGAGADGAAVIRAVVGADDPGAAAAELCATAHLSIDGIV